MPPFGKEDYPAAMSPPLPLIPLRDLALLPGTKAELMVGRAGTLAALDRAGSGLMVFAQQKRAVQATPRSLADLEPVACTGRVLKRWTTASGQIRVQVEAISRVRLDALHPQLVLLTARVNRAPPTLDPDAAEAALATYAHWSEHLGLDPRCEDPADAVYRLAHALGDRSGSTSVLACEELSEILVEVLDRLDECAGAAWVH